MSIFTMTRTQKMPMALQAQKIRLDIIGAGKDPFLFDLSAHLDSKLSFGENRQNIADLLGYHIGDMDVAGGSEYRKGIIPRQTEQNRYSLMADEYNLEQRRQRAREARRLKTPQPRQRISKKDFNKKETLDFWQSDPWPYHPTKDMDKTRKALPPGRRLSKNGYVYYERRRNRSDMPGTRV